MECFYPLSRASLDDYGHLYASHGVCNCFPACNSIEYKFELLEDAHDKNYQEWFNDYVTIEFKYRDSEYFPLIRYQEFETNDYLSYVGGLLGLFAGLKNF